ncbi:MAG: biotin carboxylase N-terminal domain-containing protein [Nitriliruptoraceae bacterium]
MSSHQLRLPRAVLIANRGEIAIRIARTCRAMGVRSVGVASQIDAEAAHVAACDDVVLIGGATPAESYLRGDALIDAALRTGADAVHPGFGFLAEDPRFAQAVLDAGLTWVGPAPAVIAAMGDKLEAKRRMATAGVPLVPGEELPPDPTAQQVQAAAERIGLPIMVKAAAGGGGKGMRAVHDRDQLVDAVASARREAGNAFGDDRVFLERLITRPRHVEVQVVGDHHGQVVHLFERECSIQRRHQKVVEECPSPGIDAEVREVLTTAATDAARALGYVSAGTVEFVVDENVLARRRAGEDVPAAEAVAFLEVNTRLQVEHPVTEEVVRVRDPHAGALLPIDLVRWQLLIAGGGALPARQEELTRVGHAIEVRLYAEDVPAGYLPATGTLSAFHVPQLPGVRRELGVRAGEVVSPHYDPMLAKVIASGPTRAEAAARLATALSLSAVQGVVTNRALLVAILRHEAFLAGDTTTAYLDEHLDELLAASRPAAQATTMAALLAAVHATAAGRQATAAGRQAIATDGPGPRVGTTAVLPGLPPAFSPSGVLWAQHHYVAADATEALDVGGDREVADASDVAEPSGVAEPGDDHEVAGPGDVAEPGDDREPVSPHQLTVRLRTARDGSFDAQVLTGVAAGHLDAEGQVQLAATARVHHLGVDHLDIEVDGHRQRVGVHVDGAGAVQIVSAALGVVELEAVPRFPDRGEEAVAGATRSPMPGVVVAVAVEEGAPVAEGALLVTVEAMKMEHRITAPQAGTVTEVRVAAGQQVDADQVLVVVEA